MDGPASAPGDARIRVHAIYHHMYVRVLAILVAHHERLMLRQPEIAKYAIDDGLHLLGRDVVLVIEANRQVIHGRLH